MTDPTLTNRHSAALSNPAAGTQPIILAIDNDPAALQLLTRFLSREGFHVMTAANGQEGLRLARQLQPAVITLDVDMPAVDGWSVLAQLKADAQLAAIPVVMITIMDDRTKGFALGVSDYLLKPLDRARLIASLRKFAGPRESKPVLIIAQDAGSRKPILIIEDDAGNRKMLTRLLQKEGWSTIEATPP